jgi:hypothetical protein
MSQAQNSWESYLIRLRCQFVRDPRLDPAIGSIIHLGALLTEI